MQDRDTISWSLQQLNANWYVNFTPMASAIPSGKSKLLHIQVGPSFTLLTTDQIQSIATEKPGAIWYVGAEPNVANSVDDVIEDLNYYYTEIARIDPTARITSPSILNWSFTCIGCGGYESGVSWMTTFLSRYQDLYGESVPWDIWAIDVYPLDWWNLPNTGFTAEKIQAYAPKMPPPGESIAAKQIQAYREFIDSQPGTAGQPIIVTEIGIHWGWSEIEYDVSGCAGASPAGEYRPLVVRDYFESIFTWLENHAISHNIERWFTYVSYSDITKCRHDGYSGMSLLDSPGASSQLTDIGRWYISRSAP